MTPCSSNHPPIAYEGEGCPLCLVIEVLVDADDYTWHYSNCPNFAPDAEHAHEKCACGIYHMEDAVRAVMEMVQPWRKL